ncbi:ribosomal protein L28e [Rhizopus microsporus var. microsporus]|uniref:Ribosomal protein L28e n=2 Tax=Rhizopus microsporus TaxID=58291 RepID=A0A2G4T865_RHIZD|nr:ribosomal protein L28e [Rhizopus microsporus ATCC 52813]ORE09211.1 ribosomal protein L28e [Rhizopus microsporus var. microsporus]PHZ17210.1 ribosomal protein L28e [Rhizopus microsporus ATCC 52813]
MSAELVWAIVKNNNSFLVKRDNAQFSSEPGNLTNLNSFKYSGIANYKNVTIQPAARGVRVTLHKAKKEQLPAKSTNTVVIAKTRRQTAKSVANLIARANKYRPDLRAAALARASAIISSQQPKKTPKAREAKGVRAQKKN